jgi:hypothetical protein
MLVQQRKGPPLKKVDNCHPCYLTKKSPKINVLKQKQRCHRGSKIRHYRYWLSNQFLHSNFLLLIFRSVISSVPAVPIPIRVNDNYSRGITIITIIIFILIKIKYGTPVRTNCQGGYTVLCTSCYSF